MCGHRVRGWRISCAVGSASLSTDRVVSILQLHNVQLPENLHSSLLTVVNIRRQIASRL